MQHFENQDQPQKLLDFKSGGWVIVAGIMLSLLFLSVLLWNAVRNENQVIGDRRNPETYGFDLTPSLIPPEQIIAAIPRDNIPTLNHPDFISPAEADRINEEERGKYLVPSDLVVGILYQGEARAYPLRVLNWHEIVNDTIGDIPIAVTYNPLSNSTVLFDRRVNGKTIELGLSGLLFNSSHLYYDRQPQSSGESLWSQLLAKAVTGPAAEANLQLEILPCTITHWQEWRKRHPETRVLAPLEEFKKRYKMNPYGSYYSSDLLRYPVDPLPQGPVSYKMPVLVLKQDEQQHAYTFKFAAEQAGPRQFWTAPNGFDDIQIRYLPDPPAVDLLNLSLDHPLDVIYTFWFAWYAHNPESQLNL
jgi:hypothetical protein